MKRIRKYIMPACFALLILSGAVDRVRADDPPDTAAAAQTEPSGFVSHGVLAPIRFFSNVLSRADGDRCPMYPSCSAYSLEVFGQHGFVKGWIMTSDRLLRCGRDELTLSPSVWIGGEKRSVDLPTDNNLW